MTFDSDSLIDRKRLKRRLASWRLAAVVAAASVGLALFARFDVAESRDYVARLFINGVILEDQKRIQALGRVARDRGAKALIVRINSPGGTVVGGEALYHHLRKIAGYMVAIGGDRIFARSGTITGSIGVIMQTTNLGGLLKKLGITTESIKSDPMKAVPSPLEPLTEKGRAFIRTIIKDTHRQFIKLVADRRGFSAEQARKLGDGRIFTGDQALSNGLIDAIGGESEARDWLAKKHGIATNLPVRDVRINRGTRNLFGLVEEMLGKTTFSERLRLDGLISLWHPE
jgi:protease-4